MAIVHHTITCDSDTLICVMSAVLSTDLNLANFVKRDKTGLHLPILIMDYLPKMRNRKSNLKEVYQYYGLFTAVLRLAEYYIIRALTLLQSSASNS